MATGTHQEEVPKAEKYLHNSWKQIILYVSYPSSISLGLQKLLIKLNFRGEYENLIHSLLYSLDFPLFVWGLLLFVIPLSVGQNNCLCIKGMRKHFLNNKLNMRYSRQGWIFELHCWRNKGEQIKNWEPIEEGH